MTVRIAVDTNVLLSGIIWPRWPYAILQHALQGDVELVLPEVVLLEARRHIRRDFPDEAERFERFLTLVNFESTPLPSADEVESASGLVRQVEDIPVALAVIAAKVDYFVTYDRDFTDDHPSTAAVRAAIPGIRLPPIFLRDVMGWSSEQLEAIRYRTWDDMVAAE